MKKTTLLLWLFIITCTARAENGYELWLRYNKISNASLLAQYKKFIEHPVVAGSSPTMQVVREELAKGLSGLSGAPVNVNIFPATQQTLLAGKASGMPFLSAALMPQLEKMGNEGYIIFTRNNTVVITANTDIGVLYGTFHFLRLLQTEQPIHSLNIISAPKLKLRMLNHWDNLNRTVERGYAGFSIWDWHTLPTYIDQRYIDYARANASIGINGTVLTNVNANALILTRSYLEKVKALADAFRPYGLKVYLTARFSAPVELSKLKTADPLDPEVQQWWKDKAKEIYSLIPDFGGFVVKANSEGQPGPQNYGRSHADGANLLADAVAPYNGVIMWRAFVYSNENPEDRHKQAYNDFVPLDGTFRSNVMVQVKNGAIDFQPREPFHPLFGAMPKTPLMMEFQPTQEYLGQATHLVYHGPLYKEVLESDTYSKGKGSTVAKVIDGSLDNHTLTGMTGVANIGNDINWCGHQFLQANWYVLGRLAWDSNLSSGQIAEEWLRMTFSNNNTFVSTALKMMMNSREIMVNYMTPLGLHHIMATGHHYGPGPWVNNLSRPEWNPTYYHRADSIGLGFNRTATGSNALSQYFPGAQELWNDINTCEEKNLLWFHHAPWTFKMNSGRTLWDELCYRYYSGTEDAKKMQQAWNSLKQYVDKERFEQVRMRLQIQYDEAKWWRNACVLYFQTFSKMPVPAGYELPDKTLEYYKGLRFPYAPGSGQ